MVRRHEESYECGHMESEAQFRVVFENCPDAIFLAYAESGIILEANKSASELMSMPREGLVGLHHSQLHPQEEAERYRAIFREHIQKGTAITQDVHIQRPSGELVPVDISARVLEVSGKRMVQGVFRDVTERRRGEGAYRAVVEHSLQGLAIMEDFRIVFANQALADFTGYTVEELLSLPPEALQEAVHPEDRELVWGLFRKRLGDEPAPSRYECRVIAKDGTLVWLEVFGSRIEYHGRPAVQAAMVDITERKQAEEELRESEERFRALSAASVEGIAIHDRGKIVDANEAFGAMFGYDVSEVIGMHILDFAAPESRDLVLEKALSGSEEPYEALGVRKDGSTIVGELRGGSLPYKGRLLRVTTLRDFTERKRAEEQEAEYVQDLKFLSEAAMTFVGLSPDVDIHRLIGEKLKELVGDSIVAIASFDAPSESFVVRTVLGIDRHVGTVVKHLGRDPVGMPVTVGDEVLSALSKRGLAQIRGDLHELTRGGISKRSGRALKKALGLGELYSMGFVRDRELFGAAVILMRKGAELRNQGIVETFINQASVAVQRRSTEEALRREKEKFQVLVEGSPVGVSAITEGGDYEYINPKFIELFGYTLEDIPTGREWFARAYPDEAYREEVISRWIADVKESADGTFTPQAFTVRCKDGSPKVTHFRTATMEAGGQIVIYEDISERTRAEDEIRRRTEELAALNSIAKTVAGSLDLDEILDRALGEVLEVMGLEVGSVRLLEEDGTLAMVAHRGASADHVRTLERLTIGKQLFRGMLSSKETVVIDDLSRYADLPAPVEEFLEQEELRSAAAVPLQSKGKVLGVLVSLSRQSHRFSSRDVELLNSIGRQIGMAVENASFYQEQKRRLSEMEALRQTTLDITRRLDKPQLLRSIVERAAALVEAKSGGLYLYHPDEEELELVVSYYLDKDYTGTRLKVGEGLSGRVALTGEPIVVEDYASLEDRPEKYSGAPFRGGMAVPLKWGDEIIGVVNVTDVDQPRRFTAHDLWLLELFASQAAIAIQNARLHEETWWQLEELSAIEEIVHELSSTLDFQKVIELVLSKAIEATDASRGTVAVVDEGKTGLRLLATEGFSAEAVAAYRERPLSVERAIVGRVVREGKPSLVGDVSQDPDYIELTPETRSQLTVPIMREDQVAGAIVLESPQLGGFSKAQQGFVQHLAKHAAVAMENARLHEETVWRLEELSAIEEIVRELSSTLDFRKVIQSVLSKAMQATDASAGAIVLPTEDGRQLPVLASEGYPVEETSGHLEGWPGTEPGIVGRVFRTGQLALVGDVSQDPNYFQVLPETRSQLTVPIIREDEVDGAIVLESSQLEAFSKEQAGFVQHLARHAVVAMENARLYERMRESEERYRTYVENVPDAVWETDADGCFIYWSPQSENLLGYAGQELLRHTAYEFLVHPDDVDRFRAEVRQIVQEKREHYTLRHRATHKDGSILQIETSVRPVWNEAGRIVKYQGVARDISERVRLQAQLIQSAKLSGIGQMIAGVAHELNNPLTTVMGYAQLLQASDVEEGVKEDLERIYNDALRAQRIVQNLLTFARQKKPQRNPVDINDTIEHTLALRRYQLKVDGVELVTELADNLPWTMADSYQLQQVFLNIVNNSHQAMAEGGRGGVLTVRSELVTGDLIRISLADTGPGISAELLDKVFDPFFTTKDVGVGTGLGLSVSHGIVQEHGGRIWVHSEQGHGATFFVELPVKSWVEEVWVPSADEEPQEASSVSRRILVVDDERNIVDLIVRALGESGYRVEGITKPRLALERLRQEAYDLIICDIRMPDMDGPEWEREMRAMGHAAAERTIFMTGDLLSPTTQAFLEQWQGKHITKPFKVQELRAIVQEALGEGAAG